MTEARSGRVDARWMPVPPSAASHQAEWRDMLSADELGRAEQFRFAEDRLAYTAAHALLRRMLCDHAGGAPQDWRFVLEANDKPVLDPGHGLTSLHFNLSHTRGMVACAIGWDAPIGIDVEPIVRDGRALEIAERFFTPAEAAFLRNIAGSEACNRAFTRLWTLKEAYLKATGQGLAEPLDGPAFRLDPVRVRLPEGSGQEANEWSFAEASPPGGYALAVAVRRTRPAAFDVIAVAIDKLKL